MNKEAPNLIPDNFNIESLEEQAVSDIIDEISDIDDLRKDIRKQDTFDRDIEFISHNQVVLYIRKAVQGIIEDVLRTAERMSFKEACRTHKVFDEEVTTGREMINGIILGKAARLAKDELVKNYNASGNWGFFDSRE